MPTISTNGITGSWSPSISNTTTTTYTFTPNAGQCATSTTLTITITDILDFVNLQFPSNATICQTVTFTAYGQIYNTGAINTPDAGQAAGVTAQIGYSTSNTNPNTWTNWIGASFNAQAGNNDEYIGSLSGLAPGTYYYTFRYQINNCGWQYGGYSATGGGAWGGSNVSGMLVVEVAPNAGNDGTLTACATGSSVNLYDILGPQAAITGSWSGPSALSGDYLGTFNPAINIAGSYTYTVSGGACPNDFSVVTVTISNSPTAGVVYPSPICTNITSAVVPVIPGATGGTFSVNPTGISLAANGGFVPSATTPNTYT
ncbi:MAG: hypothetical protein ACKOSR_09780, partial [Flavobacteriales bacterium]